jgi:hypothetical protein
VIEKIAWLRKHYHFGPAKIATYLARYHDVTISTSGVGRILKRLGMNRLPPDRPQGGGQVRLVILMRGASVLRASLRHA